MDIYLALTRKNLFKRRTTWKHSRTVSNIQHVITFKRVSESWEMKATFVRAQLLWLNP